MVLTHNHSIGTIWIFAHWLIMVRSPNWPDLGSQISKIRDKQVVGIYHLMKHWRCETNRISSVATAQPQSETHFLLWPDLLTWPLVAWGRNFYTKCLIQFSAGTEQMAALRAAVFPLSAKNRRGGYFLPPPPPVRVLTRALEGVWESHRLEGGGGI